jgi:hypothetical protein
VKVLSVKRTRIGPEPPRPEPHGGRHRGTGTHHAISRAIVAYRLLPIGLGDLVEKAAKPIAREIDSFTADLADLGLCRATQLDGCSACSKRRHFLNRIIGNVRSPVEWFTAWRRVRPAYRAVWGCSKAVRKAS